MAQPITCTLNPENEKRFLQALLVAAERISRAAGGEDLQVSAYYQNQFRIRLGECEEMSKRKRTPRKAAHTHGAREPAGAHAPAA